ncbi:zinc-dependent alcohol dehydrogenase [Neobacillus cucumis]|uniref:Sorbitol dehydrogenase n=1 Tax=Neobacillus cucumis TaxID=1740721 RepID=A0A2N5HVP6_9BACI|nr:alcohol dehydrogenase catalytic domain-containing protein [Neobacillus cucumis]PLS09576.1 sorbitol dehydrogenase [Neobacillus cucumis]
MKAIFVEEPYLVVCKEVEPQSIKANEVKVKVKVAGICGSDIHTYKGIHQFRKPPVIIGHEIAGEVVEIGENVKKVKVGDRVTVEPQEGCGHCEPCLQGETNYCMNRAAPGINEWYGAMAEYFVAPEKSVFILPDELSYEQGVLAEPLAVGVHAVEKANIRPGDRVAIIGMGPIGLLSLIAAKAAGATTILAADIMDYCLESALKCGATITINIRDQNNWMEEAKALVDGEFDKVLVAAGVPGIVNNSLSLLRRGGKLVAIAMFHKEETIDIVQLQNQEKEVIGSFCYTHKDLKNAINLLRDGKVFEDVIISHQLSFEEAAKGFELVDKKWDQSLKVLIHFK